MVNVRLKRMLYTFISRVESTFRKQFAYCVLNWKTMLFQKSTASNDGLLLEVIGNANDRLVKEALLIYGNALILSKKGRKTFCI